MLWRESKLGFRVGTKDGFSWPSPRRPPSPLPQIQSLRLTNNAEWKRPQEMETSTGSEELGFWWWSAGGGGDRRPGMGRERRKEGGRRREATGVG